MKTKNFLIYESKYKKANKIKINLISIQLLRQSIL